MKEKKKRGLRGRAMEKKKRERGVGIGKEMQGVDSRYMGGRGGEAPRLG